MMEQRKNLRFPVKFRSSFSSVGLIGGEGHIVALSIRGCHIESSIDAQPGASLDVRIQAVEGEPPIHIQAAIVRWSRGGEFGVEFEVIAPTEWALLRDVVRQIGLTPYEQDKQAADAPGSA